MSDAALKWSQLYTPCDPKQVPYALTSEAGDSEWAGMGQSRALEAIEFGIGMRHRFYNLFLLGSTGLGKHTVVEKVLKAEAAKQPTPSDWCYVNNFNQHHKPLALELPAGIAKGLSEAMAQLVEDLLIGLPAAFESQEYRGQITHINEHVEEQQEALFVELNEKSHKQEILLVRTPSGYTLVPLKDDKPMDSEAFNDLSAAQREKFEQHIETLKEELKEIILQLPALRKGAMTKIKALNQSYAESTVSQFISPLLQRYEELPQVVNYLQTVQLDIVYNFSAFLPNRQENPLAAIDTASSLPELQVYAINYLVEQSDGSGAPVIYEDNPSYNNLIGRIEHVSEYGSLITNFTLIKPGALHQANGGYLILDAERLLTKPFAWEALKRVLRASEVKIESLEQMLSLVTTISLEPAAIPVNVKVILIGSRFLYYLLKLYDPDFVELFKATVDFSESQDRDEVAIQGYARLIASLSKEENTLPIDPSGVCRIIEACSRDAEDAEKLSLHMGRLRELLLEANYWADKKQTNIIDADAVQTAIDARTRRVDQIRERANEQILRGIKLISTDGKAVGQVNALSVLQLGDFSFGQPSRITATARLGKGTLIDIERETKMGGPIHSKAVLILSSCLAERYAQERPLSLAATLVFEQNYGGIEGDSASLAEFCTLVSAISKIPLRQDFAITGSMNQKGEAQAIGGVNEKIEGFFDICAQRGLTGEQGVIIPGANVKHLMLRHDVVEAVKKKRFHIHAIDQVDQAIELLTGQAAGEQNKQQQYPKASVNQIVVEQLLEWQNISRHFGKSKPADQQDKDKHETSAAIYSPATD